MTTASGPSRHTGTFTFLFTDIEGSTSLLGELGDAYADVLGEHRLLIRKAIVENAGTEVGTEGDSFFVVFETAHAALSAAIAAQLALAEHPWPHGDGVRVRMGLHTGEAVIRDADFVGMAVHRAARISAAAHGGQILVSQETKELVDTECVDLGEHQLKDMASPEHLFQVAAPGLLSSFPPPRALIVNRHNLPQQLTSFVGRRTELDRLCQLSRSERLVTVHGPGGAGKTRLAIEVAREAAERLAGGAWMAALAGLDSPELVVSQAAAVFGITDQPGMSMIDTLSEALAERELMIVLDNCEHVLSGVATLAIGLLHRCPNVTILATSRVPLNVAGEHVWLIPPMTRPAERRIDDDAVVLFAERATAARSGFTVGRDAAAVAELCRRLDGLPLAIELAAARVRALSVDQIAARLDDRFRLLGGARAANDRQQTLEATIDWSHELLDEVERTVFRRLAVFAGSFSLEAAESVVADDAAEPGEVLETLAQLVDKSMVAVQQTPLGPRYQLLETIRAYARLRLQASPDAASAPAAHLAWIANLCVDAQTRLLGHDDVDWFERFDLELDNIRTAFEWAIAARPWVAQQLATELWVYWWTRGMLVEGRDLAERALAADASTSAALRARVHAALAYIGYCQGDQRLLEEHAETAIALAAQAGDDRLAAWPMGWALVDLAELAHWNADLSLAQSRGQEALAIGERWGEDFVAARACSSLAYTAQDQNRPLDALSFAERGVFLARGLGSKIGISRTLYTVARLYWLQGESDAARLAYEESLAFSQEAGDKLGIRGAYEGLGILAYESGDEAAARSSFEYVLEVTEAMGQPAQFRARELLTLGSTALRHGDVGPGRAWLDEARRLAHRAGDTETLQAINDFDRGAHTEPVAGR